MSLAWLRYLPIGSPSVVHQRTLPTTGGSAERRIKRGFCSMNAHLLTGVAAGLGVLTLPGTVELAALTVAGLLPRRARTKVGDVRRIKKLAVVVPAHDEATLIGRCLRSIATCV